MNAKTILAALLLVCAAPPLADAADCGPLIRLTSIDLLPLPGGGPRLLVPVMINNVPQKFLLDTGGGFTTLTATAVKNLNLRTFDGARVRLLDSAGNASRKYVPVDSFQMGSLKGTGMEFLLTPNPAAGGTNAAFDGVLAGDLMSHYDVDLDFAARKLTYFSREHCEGKVVYWQAPAVAVVPFKMFHPDNTQPGERPHFSTLPDTHIRVPVTLDGKNFMAVIDTGAGNSTMSAEVAKDVFGINADSPGSIPLGTVDHDPDHKVFGHVFASLAFAGIAVSNPHVTIIPDLIGSKDPDNSVATGGHIRRVDDGLGSQVTVGMDVLKRLHLYIAYEEKNLYITAAAAPAAGTDASVQLSGSPPQP